MHCRYQEGSGPASLLAQNLRSTMAREATLFDGDSSSMLLLIDRREDPVTPLLTQWTYQVGKTPDLWTIFLKSSCSGDGA